MNSTRTPAFLGILLLLLAASGWVFSGCAAPPPKPGRVQLDQLASRHPGYQAVVAIDAQITALRRLGPPAGPSLPPPPLDLARGGPTQSRGDPELVEGPPLGPPPATKVSPTEVASVVERIIEAAQEQGRKMAADLQAARERKLVDQRRLLARRVDREASTRQAQLEADLWPRQQAVIKEYDLRLLNARLEVGRTKPNTPEGRAATQGLEALEKEMNGRLFALQAEVDRKLADYRREREAGAAHQFEQYRADLEAADRKLLENQQTRAEREAQQLGRELAAAFGLGATPPLSPPPPPLPSAPPAIPLAGSPSSQLAVLEAMRDRLRTSLRELVRREAERAARDHGWRLVTDPHAPDITARALDWLRPQWERARRLPGKGE
jgi:hypothetical protein